MTCSPRFNQNRVVCGNEAGKKRNCDDGCFIAQRRRRQRNGRESKWHGQDFVRLWYSLCPKCILLTQMLFFYLICNREQKYHCYEVGEGPYVTGISVGMQPSLCKGQFLRSSSVEAWSPNVRVRDHILLSLQQCPLERWSATVD